MFRRTGVFSALLLLCASLAACAEEFSEQDDVHKGKNVQVTVDGIYSWKAAWYSPVGGYEAVNPLDSGWPDSDAADAVLVCWASSRSDAVVNARAGEVFTADAMRTDGTGAYYCRLVSPKSIPS
jgi:hypothetical protein